MSALIPLANRIGQRLTDIRVRSLYVNGFIAEVYQFVYLHFDDWLELASKEAGLSARIVVEPRLLPFEVDGPSTQSPINELPTGHPVDAVMGRCLSGGMKIVSLSESDASQGVELDFDGETLRVIAIDGESLDLSAGRSELPEALARRPLLGVVAGGGRDVG